MMTEEILDLLKMLNEINRNLEYHGNGLFKQTLESEKDRLEKLITKLIKENV